MMPSRTEAESSGKFAISRNQIFILGLVLILIGAFLSGRQFGWFSASRYETVEIPSGQSYTEATVIGAYEGVVLAERISTTDAEGNVLPKALEILTDEKTVFVKITQSGPVKITRAEISEGNVVWIYNRIRSLEDTLAEPADPDLAIPFEEMVKNPRERVRAGYIVLVLLDKK